MKKVNDVQEECLNILQEESAEVIQAASKVKRFGLDGRKEESEPNNLQNLEQEIGDVLALIDVLIKSDIGITESGLISAKLRKMEKLPLWSNLTNI